MENKGSSSIEMVISFLIFIAFLGAIFIYINPLNVPASSSSLTALETAVSANATIALENRGFAVNKTLLDSANINADCFIITNMYPNDPMFITDDKGANVDFVKEGNNIRVKKTSKFYYAHKGINGAKSSITCSKVQTLRPEIDYSWSVPVESQIYYNKSLAELKKAYDSSYPALRQRFNLGSADFAITVLDSGSKELFKMSKPMPNVNIVAREFPIQILSDENGIRITNGYLRLQAW